MNERKNDMIGLFVVIDFPNFVLIKLIVRTHEFLILPHLSCPQSRRKVTCGETAPRGE